jgi:hypothetical protein
LVIGKAIVGWEKGIKSGGILENFQSFFVLPIRRGQHQQQNYQAFLNVSRGEAFGLLNDFGTSPTIEIQDLTIGMLTGTQGFQGLSIDLVGGDNPQHQARLPF